MDTRGNTKRERLALKCRGVTMDNCVFKWKIILIVLYNV